MLQLLMRYVDDFLFITTDVGLASRFLRVMHAGERTRTHSGETLAEKTHSGRHTRIWLRHLAGKAPDQL